MQLLQTLAVDTQRESLAAGLQEKGSPLMGTVTLGMFGFGDTSHTVSDLALPDKKTYLPQKVFPGVFSIGNKQLQAFVTDSASTKQLKQDLEVSVKQTKWLTALG